MTRAIWIFVFPLFFIFSCKESGDDKKPVSGTPGKINITLENDTSPGLIDIAPDLLDVQFWYAALRNELGDANEGVGVEPLIYANSGCTVHEITRSWLENGELMTDDNSVDIELQTQYTFNSIGECNAFDEYINLAQDSDTVNTALNAGEYPVPPGTYKEFFLCMTGKYRFQAGTMTEAATVDLSGGTNVGGCAIVDMTSDPLVLSEGQSVALSVSYDLTSTTSTQAAGSSGGDGCVDQGDTEYCVNGADISLSISVN